MDWITGIGRAIDYIEEHLTDDIDYAEVAKQAFVKLSFSACFFNFMRLYDR